jgi:hypothetical protein
MNEDYFIEILVKTKPLEGAMTPSSSNSMLTPFDQTY